MGREKVDVEIRKRKFVVERDDMTALQVSIVAKEVEDRLLALEERSRVVDSSRLGIMLALDLACDMEGLKARLDDQDRGEVKRLEGMILALQRALAPKP